MDGLYFLKTGFLAPKGLKPSLTLSRHPLGPYLPFLEVTKQESPQPNVWVAP